MGIGWTEAWIRYYMGDSLEKFLITFPNFVIFLFPITQPISIRGGIGWTEALIRYDRDESLEKFSITFPNFAIL